MAASPDLGEWRLSTTTCGSREFPTIITPHQLGRHIIDLAQKAMRPSNICCVHRAIATRTKFRHLRLSVDLGVLYGMNRTALGWSTRIPVEKAPLPAASGALASLLELGRKKRVKKLAKKHKASTTATGHSTTATGHSTTATGHSKTATTTVVYDDDELSERASSSNSQSSDHHYYRYYYCYCCGCFRYCYCYCCNCCCHYYGYDHHCYYYG